LIGLTPETGDVVSQPKGFINTAIFDTWFEGAFLLGLTRHQKETGYDRRSVLILDNCSVHSRAKF
jgi:hypothetical protein